MKKHLQSFNSWDLEKMIQCILQARKENRNDIEITAVTEVKNVKIPIEREWTDDELKKVIASQLSNIVEADRLDVWTTP